MKRIIISTSWEKLIFLGKERQNKNLDLLNTNLFVGYNPDSDTFEAAKADTNLILIKDTATKENLIVAGLLFNKETDYFLHHTNDNALSEELGVLFGEKICEGLHETAPKYKYKPVFDIILDQKIQNAERAEKIIEELFPKGQDILEAKLEILHNCMAFEIIPELPQLLNEKHKEHYEAFKKAISTLKKENGNFKTDGTKKDHINALTDLRKAMLGA
jgi:hypothetical protein